MNPPNNFRDERLLGPEHLPACLLADIAQMTGEFKRFEPVPSNLKRNLSRPGRLDQVSDGF